MNTVELAKQLISYETTSPVTEPEAFNALKEMLESEGIEASIKERNEVYNLVAETGDGDTHVCLNGHMDVVPAGEGWMVTEPFDPKIEDGKLYGRGAADMKGGLAAQILAFIDLHNDTDFEGKATLMVVGDEEIGGFDGTEALVEEFDGYDYALIGEPTDLDVQVGVRGVYWADIYIKGESSHASRPHTAYNVVDDLPAVLNALKEMEMTYEPDEQLPEPTAPVTSVETDGPQNSLPGRVRVGLDIRYVPGQTAEQVRKDIEEALAPFDITFEVVIKDLGAAFSLADNRFKEIATNTVTEVMGRTPQHITNGGSSDGRFFAERGTPFIELGPGQKPGHQADEHCRIDNLELLREAYSTITKRLAAHSSR